MCSFYLHDFSPPLTLSPLQGAGPINFQSVRILSSGDQTPQFGSEILNSLLGTLYLAGHSVHRFRVDLREACIDCCFRQVCALIFVIPFLFHERCRELFGFFPRGASISSFHQRLPPCYFKTFCSLERASAVCSSSVPSCLASS
ncbi:MAG: hypothetical protein CM1200mP40_27690 [Gammaproteobacteria bacterium]|nr:MAG: hypothetical protein CM1200mP40_27690 [Gammaproteobacteria bacterium]